MSPRNALALAAALLAGSAGASPFGNGKLLLTGGVSSLDGAAGGGLTPWAVTGSYATGSQIGATAFATRVRSQDYALSVVGAAVGIGDRAEVSIARQDFDTGDKLEYLKVVVRLATRREDLGPDFRAWLDDFVAGKDGS